MGRAQTLNLCASTVTPLRRVMVGRSARGQIPPLGTGPTPTHMDGRGTLAGSKPSPARAISLASRVTVNGTPLSETNTRADLASRFSVRSAHNFIPEQLEVYLDLPRIRTLASNNYVRTRWDRSTAKYAAPETPADAALVAKMTNSSAKASRRFSSNFSTVTKTLQRRSK